ncbi:DUF2306 domain-containing protein [Nocardiopsis lambiniae]|uniref:DUF2306 domain-containing protein n=1 Tax=Nocardiopsis lambiniae TaxID=3075539 RepID=A0ABU2M7C3_9ACTN|nr:DUF2306 domain-containing protein [Nocardiopsis sp. DSM 44743]MDT0328574.1 DUF2306 domain-containing protein [Nocardiopsis sp. DSM 44743]
MTSSTRREWPVPALLILLSVVPVIAGAARLGEVAVGAPVTPDNARFFADPVPVVLHIAAAVPYCVLGALQFVPGLRRRRWHRVTGRLLVPLGLIAALTGLWMTLFYALPAIDVGLLTAIRLVFGAAMAIAIVLGFLAIRRRDVAAHRAWMIRGYAIAQGAGTQVFTHLPWMLFLGPPDQLTRALLMAAGWVINVAVAEWVIRRSTAAPRRPAPALKGTSVDRA